MSNCNSLMLQNLWMWCVGSYKCLFVISCIFSSPNYGVLLNLTSQAVCLYSVPVVVICGCMVRSVLEIFTQLSLLNIRTI